MLKFTNRNLVQARTIQTKSVSQISQVYALMNNIHTTLQNEKEKCSSEEKAQCQFLLEKEKKNVSLFSLLTHKICLKDQTGGMQM